MLLCEKPYFFEFREDYHSEKQRKCHKTLFRCGKCFACRLQRSTDWKNRILLEARSYGESNCLFLTLTFSDDALSERGNASLDKRDLQLFFKRLRIRFSRLLGIKNIRYYACGEYGSRTSRPHYHAVIFGISNNSFHRELITSCWGHGFSYFGSLTPSSAAYVSGYCAKNELSEIDSRPEDTLPEFHIQSQGLGRDFVDSVVSCYKKGDSDVVRVIRFCGRFMFLPLYVIRKARQKIFNSDYIDKLSTALLLNYKTDFFSKLSLDDYNSEHPDTVITRYLSFIKQKILNLKSIYSKSYYRRVSHEKIQI